MRLHRDIRDPEAFLTSHRAVLRRLVAEGREPAPLMGPDQFSHRLAADHEEAGESVRRGLLRWGAALRQTFGLVRPEYRERP